ncbi:Cytoplasmic dynein 1 intermediate chain 1 [Varanus komodoensis]|nr:Cytoplasmic dynein 1 intermediate chain 1 [Varanus komodoensis]
MLAAGPRLSSISKVPYFILVTLGEAQPVTFISASLAQETVPVLGRGDAFLLNKMQLQDQKCQSSTSFILPLCVQSLHVLTWDTCYFHYLVPTPMSPSPKSVSTPSEAGSQDSGDLGPVGSRRLHKLGVSKITQVDFLPREVVSYSKETQTPLDTHRAEVLNCLGLEYLNDQLLPNVPHHMLSSSPETELWMFWLSDTAEQQIIRCFLVMATLVEICQSLIY